LYLLIQLLREEAGHVSMQVSLLSNNKLKRGRRKRHQDLQAKVFNLWDQFNAGEITNTIKEAPKKHSYIYKPEIK
jgi:hypothetical protein